MRDLLILGSGRSGTSMLAGALAGAGYFMGDAFWPPRASNPRGFFEDREINLLNERLIASALRHRWPRWLPAALRPRPFADYQRWLAPLPLGARFDAEPEQVERIRQLAARRPFCYKDPRFCYVLPVWRPHLADAAYLCIFRDPAVTVQSILEECRNEPYLHSLAVTREQALRVWRLMYRHVLDIHRHAGDWLFVHYRQILSGDGFARLERFTGARVDRGFPDAALERTAAAGAVPAAVRRTYAELCALAGYAD